MSRGAAIGFTIYWFCLGVFNVVAVIGGAGGVSAAMAMLSGFMFAIYSRQAIAA